MIESDTDKRYGATPVMSRAGGVPIPLPRSPNGITQATRAPSSKGPNQARRVKIKQRRLNTVRATSTQSATPTQQTHQKQRSNLNILQINIDEFQIKRLFWPTSSVRRTSTWPLSRKPSIKTQTPT